MISSLTSPSKTREDLVFSQLRTFIIFIVDSFLQGELREILKRFMAKVFPSHRHDHRKQVTIFHPSQTQDFLRLFQSRNEMLDGIYS